MTGRLNTWIAAAGMALLAAAAWAQDAGQDDAADRPQDPAAILTVTGHGTTTAVPDMATVALGVVAEAPGPGDAVAAMTGAMAAVLDALRAAGIAPADLQTGQLMLHPVYTDRIGDDGTPPRIDRYRAETTVSARVRDLEALGSILDAAVAQGANRLDSVTFGLADPQPAQDAALTAAVGDARRKARLMAEAASLSLGPVQRLEEMADGPPRPLMMREAAAMSMDAAIAGGEVDVRATVTLDVALVAP